MQIITEGCEFILRLPVRRGGVSWVAMDSVLVRVPFSMGGRAEPPSLRCSLCRRLSCPTGAETAVFHRNLYQPPYKLFCCVSKLLILLYLAPKKDGFHTTSQKRKLLKEKGDHLAIGNSEKSRDKALLQRLVRGVNGRKPDLIRRDVGAGIRLSRPVDIWQQEVR